MHVKPMVEQADIQAEEQLLTKASDTLAHCDSVIDLQVLWTNELGDEPVGKAPPGVG